MTNYKNQFQNIMTNINNDNYTDMDRALDMAYAEQAKAYARKKSIREGSVESIINAVSEIVYQDVLTTLDVAHYVEPRMEIGFH